MTDILKNRIGWIRRTIYKYFRRPFRVMALIFLTCSILVGIGADLLASDKPLACKINGQLHILPAFFHTPELLDHDNQTIETYIGDHGGWALLPPVPFGPFQAKINGKIHWLATPSKQHWFGTDASGRDVLARLIHGTRTAHLVGLGSWCLTTFLGILLGAVAAYFGGRTDRIALIIIETLTAFPTFFLILAIQGLLGSTSLFQLVLIVGATTWTEVARVTRAEVLRVINEDYVDAARALGLTHIRILSRHVLPGAISPVLVSATFGIAGAILIESTLSFLGFGAPPPTASWGQLLSDAFANESCLWLTIYPGLVLFFTVLSINIVGEGMRDAVER